MFDYYKKYCLFYFITHFSNYLIFYTIIIGYIFIFLTKFQFKNNTNDKILFHQGAFNIMLLLNILNKLLCLIKIIKKQLNRIKKYEYLLVI